MKWMRHTLAFLVYFGSVQAFAHTEEADITRDDAEAWYLDTIGGNIKNGLPVDENGRPLKTLSLDSYSSLTPCFPEKELRYLCGLELEHVKKLYLNRDTCSKEDKIKGHALHQIGRCLPNLNFIDLDSNEIQTLDGFRSFSDALNVVKLSLQADDSLENLDFSPFNALPQLSTLYVDSISQETLNSLHSDSLEDFHFTGDQIHNLSILVQQLPALRTLAIVRQKPLSVEEFQTLIDLDLVSLSVAPTSVGAIAATLSLDPEAKSWMIQKSPRVFVDPVFESDDLMSVLERKNAPESLVVNHSLEKQELEAVLMGARGIVVFNKYSRQGMLDALESVEEVSANEIWFRRWGLCGNVKIVDGELVIPTIEDDIASFFNGRTTKVKSWFTEKYRFIVKPLAREKDVVENFCVRATAED